MKQNPRKSRLSRHAQLNQTVSDLVARATAFEQTGRFMDARLGYQSALAIDKTNLAATVGLGRILLKSGQPQAAVPYLEKAVKIDPRISSLRNLLALALFAIGRIDRAAQQAQYSHKLDKKSVGTLDILQKIYSSLGRSTTAQHYLEQAIKLNPDDPKLLLKLASHYDVSNEPKKAHELYRSLIHHKHISARAYYGMIAQTQFAFEPPELTAIETLLMDGEMNQRDRELLHRSAGKIADDLGRYDQAFKHFAAAGKTRGREDGNVEIRIARQIERIRMAVSRGGFANRGQLGHKSCRPVFVFGMPRSGTTLVEQILASHSQVYGAGELTFFRHVSTHPPHDDLTRAKAQKIEREYLDLLNAYSPSAKRIVNKMPYNFENLSTIALMFPNAKFIHCRRNPIATCLSCFIKPLRGQYLQSGDLVSIGRYYRYYLELMTLWRELLPVQILEVDYEQVVLNTEVESRRLLSHVGLDWEDACLRFYETKRSVMTPSRRQVERPIYTSSLDAWRNYSKHLGPLIETLGDAVPPGEAAGSTARSL